VSSLRDRVDPTHGDEYQDKDPDVEASEDNVLADQVVHPGEVSFIWDDHSRVD
jgi:hypothetical protein